MTQLNPARAAVAGLPSIKATKISASPAWALMQRQLIDLINEAAPAMMRKYSERGSNAYFADDVDDQFEMFHNWGTFYAIGGGEHVLDLALEKWNAVARWNDDSIVSRKRHSEYWHGDLRQYNQQIHNEYYNLATPGGADWHHMGEGNQAFYAFGLADPTISENVRRARRFAAMFMGEDPKADNWDPKYRVFRSPIITSVGPYRNATVEFAKAWLQGGGRRWKIGWYPESPVPTGLRSSLYPVVKDLEVNWFETEKRRNQILEIFNRVVLDGDVANSLAATALMTNAYLYTGDEKYRRWVLEYVEVWMDRIRKNNGIIPDNVGPHGIIGEHREGVWFGGLYGWNYYMGMNVIFHGATVASECALMLTGDYGYLDLLRSQLKMLFSHSYKRADGQLMVPTRASRDGWTHDTAGKPRPFRLQDIAHLYHASQSAEDRSMIEWLRAGDVVRDWNAIPRRHEKNEGEAEAARFQYYQGRNPGWPEQTLSQDYQIAVEAFRKIVEEKRDPEQQIVENASPGDPIITKGLVNTTMGSPQNVYCGGLLRATVRYFDIDNNRPGLPADVGALVDRLEPRLVGIQLVNTSATETRNLIVHAGAFGEHQFTEVTFRKEGDAGLTATRVDGKDFAVTLPPMTSIHVDAGLQRFANRPSYAFPWHGDRVPVPFG
ncbi:MAG: hypothetical protein FJ319_06360 [SAR202 cluster bacterium]|nr:hypothetical protein [SAR202 cluster bacterium]